MKKKYKFRGDDYWMLVLAFILIAFAVMTYLTSIGKEQMMVYIMTGLGVVGVIIGFLLGSFIGVGVAVAVLWGFVKLLELFPIPMALLFLAGGIAMIVWWIKECMHEETGDSRNSGDDSEADSGASSGSGSSSSSGASQLKERYWSDYKNRTDYEEMVINSSDSDGQYAAFMLLGVGTQLHSVYYSGDDTTGFMANGKHLHTFNKEQEDMILRLQPEACFVSDIKRSGSSYGSYTVTVRCYK